MSRWAPTGNMLERELLNSKRFSIDSIEKDRKTGVNVLPVKLNPLETEQDFFS